MRKIPDGEKKIKKLLEQKTNYEKWIKKIESGELYISGNDLKNELYLDKNNMDS